MFGKVSRPSHATVVAYLALFVALGGSGYAAVAINGNNIKDRTIAARKVKKNTLTGTEIKESKLAKVPRAARADSATSARSATNATNASQLAGKPASAYAPSACPAAMVRVGPTCIDRYEDSIWTQPYGGTQLTTEAQIDAACPNDGQPTQSAPCTGFYALSVAGVKPAASITWAQAQQALANSGKRLPTNAEWQAAVSGTPNPGLDNGTTDCNSAYGAAVNTGSRSSCVSRFGAYDMVGNLWEWVAEWVPAATNCTASLFASGDANCFAGASTIAGPSALRRGGAFNSGSDAGPFAVDAFTQPSGSFGHFGFRGAR